MSEQEYQDADVQEFVERLEEFRSERQAARWAALGQIQMPPFAPSRDPCDWNPKEMCEKLVPWVRETSRFNWQVYKFLKDEFGFPGGAIDPPPKPPF